VENIKNLYPPQRWAMMDGADAWTDVINTWTQFDQTGPHSLTFTHSVSKTINGREDADCGSLLATSNCDSTVTCSDYVGVGNAGQAIPAGYEIWNSMVVIHEVCKE
jgi:hypothetical protein